MKSSPVPIANVEAKALAYAIKQREWIATCNSGRTPTELDFYKEGVAEGYLKCIAELEELGIIKRTYI